VSPAIQLSDDDRTFAMPLLREEVDRAGHRGPHVEHHARSISQFVTVVSVQYDDPRGGSRPQLEARELRVIDSTGAVRVRPGTTGAARPMTVAELLEEIERSGPRDARWQHFFNGRSDA
jgi:hypothetical protein